MADDSHLDPVPGHLKLHSMSASPPGLLEHTLGARGDRSVTQVRRDEYLPPTASLAVVELRNVHGDEVLLRQGAVRRRPVVLLPFFGARLPDGREPSPAVGVAP